MNNGSSTQHFKAFSLLEIILTLGILLAISAFVFPVAVNKAGKQKLESYAIQLATDLYHQQQNCEHKNKAGGMLLESNRYIVYDGSSYSTAIEEVPKNLPGNIRIQSISLTSSNEIKFDAGQFKPSVYGSLILTDGVNSVRIYINQEGLIAHESI